MSTRFTETPGVLTTAMSEGSDRAFREFHAAWFDRLFRYCFVLMRGDEHAAKDVTQETLLRIVRHIRRFEREEDFWSWIRCLARSAAADYGRKRSRYRRVMEFFALEPEPDAEPDAPVAQLAFLQKGLCLLDADAEALLRRKYEEGVSVRRLAEAEGLSEVAIESRLSRARRDLRAILSRLSKQHDHEA